MARNIKVLGLALIAVLAVSAVVATAASAAEFHFEKAPVTLTGTQEGSDIIVTDWGSVECKSITYKGTASKEATSTMQLAPSSPTCLFFGFPGSLTMNGCEYLYHVEEKVGSNFVGSMDIVCPESKEITLVMNWGLATYCTIHIPAQKKLKTVTFKNVGSGSTREITAEFELSNITYSQTAGVGPKKCTTDPHTTNGKHSGIALLTGEEDKEKEPAHAGIWVE